MKRTALILAGAAAFDLGVMAVAAQAQQQTREPPRISGPGAGRETAPSGLAVQDPTGPGGNGGCTPGLPNSGGSTGPCTGAPVAISDQAGAAGGQEPRRSAGPGGNIKWDIEYRFFKIEAALTPRACIARRGEVVMHEGVRQCRLPATTRSEDVNGPMMGVSTTR
ncbi:MAG: hypothetical protein Q7J13_13350 [Brevundimonas sp.]|uniref:hypothetical protein n=1 Tax=Brevundimonas sp. TaxID=1871086 RepID=UPI00271D8433|nr:hypothetical protein [Brevundimonas sp.]MDO9588906.1 hypothetical protein [Brevundimonas sp.]